MLQTVMIVDDSMPLHALVKVQLEPDCMHIHSVYDGESAVTTAVSLQPDLILLDVDMPQMDGFEACRQIKANPKTAGIPLVFLSADSISSDKLKGLGLGAVAYIVKPFKPDELISRVRSLLQPVPVSTNPRLVDSLTGLGNKEFFDQDLDQQISITQQAKQPLACTVVEVDQLGAITSKYGALVANQVARRVASLLSDRIGKESAVYSLPNRRFAILSTNTDRFNAANTAERLRQSLEQKFVSDRGTTIEVTCSFGVCDMSIATPETILDRAATVANRASNRGGNCVSMARAHAQTGMAA
jgi:diguanylate cyclase (GGDEF)-like protein